MALSSNLGEDLQAKWGPETHGIPVGSKSRFPNLPPGEKAVLPAYSCVLLPGLSTFLPIEKKKKKVCFQLHPTLTHGSRAAAWTLIQVPDFLCNCEQVALQLWASIPLKCLSNIRRLGQIVGSTDGLQGTHNPPPHKP